MIFGVFRDHLARVTLTLPGTNGPVTVEFILDTSFEGDLALPSTTLRQLDVQPLFLTVRALGDGTLVECPVYQIELEWNETSRTVDILALEHNPLLGTMLLDGCHLDIDLTENGEVVVELPVNANQIAKRVQYPLHYISPLCLTMVLDAYWLPFRIGEYVVDTFAYGSSPVMLTITRKGRLRPFMPRRTRLLAYHYTTRFGKRERQEARAKASIIVNNARSLR